MRRGLGRLLGLVALALATCVGSQRAEGHPARMATAAVRISGDGAVELTVTCDVPALTLDTPPHQVDDSAMARLLGGTRGELDRHLSETRARFAAGVHVKADSVDVPIEVTAFPGGAELAAWTGAEARALPAMVPISARAVLPAGTRAVTFGLPDILGPVVLTIERPGQDGLAVGLEAGDLTPPIPVQLNAAAAPGGAATKPVARGAEPGALRVLGQFIRMGFEHIIPKGTDHILFVLGLFFLSPKMRPLLWQVTAFTVAHSITLALSLYGVVRLPEHVVEPLIAASIAFVAVENLFTSELKPWRPAVVFAFGLVHGLGFAGILTSVGLPRAQFFPALIAFNVGVELGQLAVIALAFGLVGWFRHRAWYRGAVVIPASVLIGGMGLFWTVERLV